MEESHHVRKSERKCGESSEQGIWTGRCIRHELEAWLLCDGKALTTYLDNTNHPIKAIADEKRPDQHKNPKVVLGKIFDLHGREYRDSVHAPKLIGLVKNLAKLRKSQVAKLRTAVR